VDIGCGTGSWLASFVANGVHDVLGFDGDWVNTAQLKIPVERFVRQDLTSPVAMDRRFDLAMCLEVAEHLPAGRAHSLVRDLTRLASCVLFSAAVPGQGGTNHVNEQFLSYWAEYFEQEGFVPINLIRPLIWADDKVEWWYRQNLIIFADADHPILKQDIQLRVANNYLHPRFAEQLQQKLRLEPMTMGRLVRDFPGVLRNSVRVRVGRLLGK